MLNLLDCNSFFAGMSPQKIFMIKNLFGSALISQHIFPISRIFPSNYSGSWLEIFNYFKEFLLGISPLLWIPSRDFAVKSAKNQKDSKVSPLISAGIFTIFLGPDYSFQDMKIFHMSSSSLSHILQQEIFVIWKIFTLFSPKYFFL